MILLYINVINEADENGTFENSANIHKKNK